MRAKVLAAEAGVLALLGMAFLVTGRLLGAALLLGLGLLGATSAWALWPTDRYRRWRRTS
jgi:hypothetical protein